MAEGAGFVKGINSVERLRCRFWPLSSGVGDSDRLEAALFASMRATGDADLVGLEFEAHIKGKPVAVVINDASKIPAAFMRVPEPTPPKAVPDKTAIKAALQKGDAVDGCELGPDKKLVIL